MVLKSQKAAEKKLLWANAAIITVIFFAAIGIRLLYQNEAVVENHLIGDAKEYFVAAHNLHTYTVFSTEIPDQEGVPPQADAARSPGYPLFLQPYFNLYGDDVEKLLNRVMTSQAIIGAVSAVLVYILASMVMSLPAAIFSAVLTVLSPHLIAMENYLLTETLFTFIMLAGCILLVQARRKSGWRLFIAGALFGLACLVRPLSILLGPFLLLPWIATEKKFFSAAGSKALVGSVLLFGVGFLLIFSPYLMRNSLTLGDPFPEGGRGWASFVEGSYVNLIHEDPEMSGWPYMDDPEYQQMRVDKEHFWKVFKERFSSRPAEYIGWYMGGKVLCSWRWDVVSGNRDVYVLPMSRFPFITNSFLVQVRAVMKVLHWPVVCLAFLSPLLLFCFRSRLNRHEVLFVLLLFAIVVYHAAIATVMFPLPRYTIPLRPIAYILAAWTLNAVVCRVKR